MCTVTLIPLGKTDFLLTSNRDEAPNRETLEPDFYLERGVGLLYPKDVLAGGTWIGLSKKNRLICLLNGGFAAYKRQDNYRLSRGVVVKDLLIASNFLELIESYNLLGIEPFTIVLVDWQEELHFYELVWDGVAKHIKKLPLEPNIWSSSTLYSKNMKQARVDWFEAFRNQYVLNSESIWDFHNTAGTGNQDFGVIMNRGFVKTTSITQVEKQGGNLEMRFLNLQKNKMSSTTFTSEKTSHD
ncbi:hypothetical protein DI383_05525 [Flavobacteriaceae bacterium LYZ1037]|nr:hypothetical protein DI383_05525 [Flavobacteriaceae bacterium LYZ1037]